MLFQPRRGRPAPHPGMRTTPAVRALRRYGYRVRCPQLRKVLARVLDKDQTCSWRPPDLAFEKLVGRAGFEPAMFTAKGPDLQSDATPPSLPPTQRRALKGVINIDGWSGWEDLKLG